MNKAGGVNGLPVKFDVVDDQTNPVITVQLFSQIVAQHKSIVIGPGAAASIVAVTPLDKDGPVCIVSSPSVHPDEGGYVFAPHASSIDLAIATTNFAKKRGWKKIAFMVTTDATGQDGQKTMQQVFNGPEGKGTKIVDVESFGATDLTVAAQVAKIKAVAPDAAYVIATGARPSSSGARPGRRRVA